jgi:hypothetical protein
MHRLRAGEAGRAESRCYPETHIGKAPAGRPANGTLAAAMFWIRDIGIRYRVPGTETSRETLAHAREKLRVLTGEVRARGF